LHFNEWATALLTVGQSHFELAAITELWA